MEIVSKGVYLMSHQQFNAYLCVITTSLIPLCAHAQTGDQLDCALDASGQCISLEDAETPTHVTAVNPRFTVSWFDDNGDHHDDNLRVEFDVIDDAAPTGGYAVIAALGQDPIFPDNVVVHDRDAHVRDLRFSMPERAGLLRASVCGVHKETGASMGCSETIDIEIVSRLDTHVAIHGDDPADESGSISAQFQRSWHDENGDGHDDLLAVNWSVEGDLGASHGFVVLSGMTEHLEFPRDLAGQDLWSGARYMRLPLPEHAGTLYTQVCAFDHFRFTTTQCSPSTQISLVSNAQSVIPIFDRDPKEETGSLSVELNRSWRDENLDHHDDFIRVRWRREGELGETSGFVVLAGFDDDLVYPRDLAWRRAWTGFRDADLTIPDVTGLYHVKVCAFDAYRGQVTECSASTHIKLVQGAQAVVAIHGMDPQDETGDVNAEIRRNWRDEDGDGHGDDVSISWTREGNVGSTSGFRIYAAVDMDPIPVNEHFVGESWAGGDYYEFPVPQVEGQLNVRVCGYDHYRDQATTCSDVVEIEGVYNRNGRVVLMHGPDPRDEMGYVDINFEEDWWYTKSTGRYDRFKAFWEIGGDLGDSGGFVILGALSTEPSYPEHTIVRRHAGHSWHGGRIFAPETSGDYLIKICALDEYRDEITVCSDTHTIPMINGVHGITALLDGDPRDEEGELTARLVRSWQDHNGDGLDDTIKIKWAVTGTLGATSGFTVLMGDRAELSYPEDLAWQHHWKGFRHVKLTPPQRIGDLYTQVCAFDEYRGEVTRCSDAMRVRLIEKHDLIVPVSPRDPIDETGSINAWRSGNQVEWQVQGDLGESGGLMILMSPHGDINSPTDRVQEQIWNNRPGKRDVRRHLESRAAQWSVAVCNYDRYRETTHQCSDVIDFSSVQRGGRVQVIHGVDPRNETGSINATIDGHLISWATTGNVGAGSGFRVLYTQESIPTLLNAQAISASSDDRALIIDRVSETATHQIRVCAYDEYRDVLGICSNVLTQDLTQTEEMDEACTPVNESWVDDYDVISGQTLAVTSPTIYPDLEGPHTEEEAARFLQRATFGTTRADIDQLLELGYNGWIQEQFAAAPSQFLSWLTRREEACEHVDAHTIADTFYHNAVGGEDQLRQRMAFALSQIFVVSHANLAVRHPSALGAYYDDLQAHSFGHFRSLIERVTLSPAMGTYLGMLNNRAPRADEDFSPDENFARELMQLFSIGLYQLNLDGTLVLDEMGHAIPTYDQTAIKGLARALTGWTLNGADYVEGWSMPMIPVDELPGHDPFRHHDSDEKILFHDPMTGARITLPAGQNAREDLEDVLTILAQHNNTAPFISEQLIQRFVTSNPTPEYVERVAAIFVDNGRGERGDLGAVIQAVLLDPEALRGHEERPEIFGKVKEPVLRETALIRALGGYAHGDRQYTWSVHSVQGQRPLGAPSVFNFYRPDYRLTSSGASDEAPSAEEATAVAPELQIATDTWILRSLNRLVNHTHEGSMVTAPALIALDLLAQDPVSLVNHLNLALFGGAMSSEMQTIVVNYASAVPIDLNTHQRISRVLELLISSPQFSVQH